MTVDRLGTERWINEGGHTATDAVIQRETANEDAGRVLCDDATAGEC